MKLIVLLNGLIPVSLLMPPYRVPDMLRPLQGAGVYTYTCSKHLINIFEQFIDSDGAPHKLSLLTVIVGCLSHF